MRLAKRRIWNQKNVSSLITVVRYDVVMNLIDKYLWCCHISCHFCVHLYDGSRPEELRHLCCFKPKLSNKIIQENYNKSIWEKLHLFQDKTSANNQEVEDCSNNCIEQDGAYIGHKHPVSSMWLSSSSRPHHHHHDHHIYIIIIITTCYGEHRPPLEWLVEATCRKISLEWTLGRSCAPPVVGFDTRCSICCEKVNVWRWDFMMSPKLLKDAIIDKVNNDNNI